MKKLIAITLIILSVAVFTSCTYVTEKSNVQLNIGILPDVDSIPLIIASEKGYFQEEGVNVTLTRFSSALERDSALQSKNVDGVVSDILAAAFAQDGGFQVKITSMTNGIYRLIVGKETGIDSFEGIKGKSVALSKNTIIEYSTDALLKESNIDPNDIDKVVVPQIPLRLEMLQNGKIDGATLPEPLASVAISSGAKELGSTDKLGINPGVMVFTEESVKSKAKEIKLFYKAYNRAVEYLLNEEISSYIDVLIEKAAFPEVVKDTISLPEYNKASLPAKKDFEGTMEWLLEKELIKKQYKYEELVDGRFLE